MNRELLLRTATAIETNPHHFEMNGWYTHNECGTTACIAGWALYLDSGLGELKTMADKWKSGNYNFYNPTFIRQILQLGCDEFYALASIDLWTNHGLRDKYLTAKTLEQKAKAAADYVRWFVKNK